MQHILFKDISHLPGKGFFLGGGSEWYLKGTNANLIHEALSCRERRNASNHRQRTRLTRRSRRIIFPPAFITKDVKPRGVPYSNVCKTFLPESVLAPRWRCVNCVPACLYEIRVLLRLAGWCWWCWSCWGVQSWNWLPSARSDDEWRMITKCYFYDTRASDLNISNQVTLTPPAFISPFVSVSVCSAYVLCVCVCVCQFNFLFQHVIIYGVEKGVRKARVLSLFPFTPQSATTRYNQRMQMSQRGVMFCCFAWRKHVMK